MTQLWCKSNSTCRATYWMYIPSFKLISQSMLKKSPENADGRTGRIKNDQINNISHMKLLIILLLKSNYSRITMPSGIILYMRPTNAGRCYNVTLSLIGWVHSQNNPCALQIPRLQAYFMGCTIWTAYYTTNLENILYSLQGRIPWDQVICSKATGN